MVDMLDLLLLLFFSRWFPFSTPRQRTRSMEIGGTRPNTPNFVGSRLSSYGSEDQAKYTSSIADSEDDLQQEFPGFDNIPILPTVASVNMSDTHEDPATAATSARQAMIEEVQWVTPHKGN